MTQLAPEQAQLLGVLALTVLKQHDGDTVVINEDYTTRKCRMVRVGNVALIEEPADDQSPKRIDCYAVEPENFGLGENGKKFKLDPRCGLFTIQYQHNAEPPDLDLCAAARP